MAIKKQPDSVPGKIPEAANEWLRLFLKHFEIHLVEHAQRLNAESLLRDLSLAALRAVKLTLLDSGLPAERLTELLGLVAFENAGTTETLQWNGQLNARRFALIDQEIQGTLSDNHKLELVALTQLMRLTIDSEQNLPMEGARKLHRILTEPGVGGAQPDR